MYSCLLLRLRGSSRSFLTTIHHDPPGGCGPKSSWPPSRSPQRQTPRAAQSRGACAPTCGQFGASRGGGGRGDGRGARRREVSPAASTWACVGRRSLCPSQALIHRPSCPKPLPAAAHTACGPHSVSPHPAAGGWLTSNPPTHPPPTHTHTHAHSHTRTHARTHIPHTVAHHSNPTPP